MSENNSQNKKSFLTNFNQSTDSNTDSIKRKPIIIQREKVIITKPIFISKYRNFKEFIIVAILKILLSLLFLDIITYIALHEITK